MSPIAPLQITRQREQLFLGLFQKLSRFAPPQPNKQEATSTSASSEVFEVLHLADWFRTANKSLDRSQLGAHWAFPAARTDPPERGASSPGIMPGRITSGAGGLSKAPCIARPHIRMRPPTYGPSRVLSCRPRVPALLPPRHWRRRAQRTETPECGLSCGEPGAMAEQVHARKRLVVVQVLPLAKCGSLITRLISCKSPALNDSAVFLVPF